MLLDQSTVLSDAQAITATANSTNILDMLPAGKQYNGNQLVRVNGVNHVPFLIQVVEDFDAITTLTVKIQTSEVVGFGTSTDVASFTVAAAQLKKGFKIPYPILPVGIKGRYLRVRYEVVGGPPTTGKVTAAVVAAVDFGYVGNV